MKPGDIVRVKNCGVFAEALGRGVLIKASGGAVLLDGDEILLVLGEALDHSIKILHPRHGAGWIRHARLEVISEAR